MKFLLDANLGEAVKSFLIQQGQDTLRISGELADSTDQSILELARREKRVIITNDKDFGALVFKNHQTHSGVILLRLENNRSKHVNEVLQKILKLAENEIDGRFIVITEKTIRIR